MTIYREEFKQYILRKLGAPVIKINIADEQLEDAIDDALLFYTEHHFDGVERVYLVHTFTAQDIVNRYVEVSPLVQSVVRVVNPETITRLNDGLFDARYQFMLSEVFNITSANMIDYDNAMKQIELVDKIVGKGVPVRFNKNKRRIEMDIDWTEIYAGKTLMFECYRALDPDEWEAVFEDRWLKKYATALAKYQWGQNLSKFTGVQLPGGITLDGVTIKTEAKEEITLLEEELKEGYQMPLGFFVG